jgi:hypothetical protein
VLRLELAGGRRVYLRSRDYLEEPADVELVELLRSVFGDRLEVARREKAKPK